MTLPVMQTPVLATDTWRDWGVTRRVVESRPDGSLPFWELLSLPGDLYVIVAVLGLLALYDSIGAIKHDPPDAPLCPPETGALIAIVFGGLALITGLEALLAQPRPPAAWQAIAVSPYSLPSGHVMAATITWGAIMWLYRPLIHTRWRQLLVVTVLVGLTALSRLFLGVHYLPDVLIGVGFGIAYLWLVSFGLHKSPRHAFVVALGIGIVAVVIATNSRALLAVSGTLGAAIGWIVIEQPVVRRTVRGLLRR